MLKVPQVDADAAPFSYVAGGPERRHSDSPKPLLAPHVDALRAKVGWVRL